MGKLEAVYQALNSAQREAVDTIEGPLLVIAGPGTGKTQLLSARVANILQRTDTPARNILCLTFTESGAENMRARLASFIGPSAYDVTISTYHAFGGDLIRRFPEYFQETRLQNSVDELGQRQIITDIVERMSYTNPLKQTRHHLDDLLSTLSEVKRALLKPDELRGLADENIAYIHRVSRDLPKLLAGFTRMPTFKKAQPVFIRILDALGAHAPATPVVPKFGSLAQVAVQELSAALDTAEESSSSKPLTIWKNEWLIKNDKNEFLLAGELESKRIRALADTLEQYEAALAARGLYDFDDMILKSISVLECHADLRFTLQEQYLYILLDEFQDTNAAQSRLVQLLADNPVNEARPNLMAVGDDDQAIYAFQGAQYSNMLDFYRSYRDVRVINLTENYRSHADILATAQNVASQIQERLHHHFEGASKNLIAANQSLPERSVITRKEFLSDIGQADAIAREIRSLIDRGVSPREIAVIAPRHKQLEPLVPYLNALKVPVRYEKRENILEAPIVKQLTTMSRLVLAIAKGEEAKADHLWPEVLSYDFWHIPISRIWEMSWQVAAERHAKKEHISWSQALLADGTTFRIPALLFLALAAKTGQETCETILDYLIGTNAIDTNETDLPRVYSPLREYYTSGAMRAEQPELFYETLSHLAVLRSRLRDHQDMNDVALTLQNLVDFIDMYEAAEERMINTSPYSQQVEAVQLMTVFKAKGLEFQHVFLPNLQDEVWGGTSRGQSNRLTLPPNIAPIRHAGATDDERLRILFVAITRAKIGLHMSSVAQNYSGKPTKRLRYLDEREGDDGQIRDFILPEFTQAVQRVETEPPAIGLLERNWDWRRHHTNGLAVTDLHALLRDTIGNYHLSPTHLSSFIDLEYGGPQRFFFTTILRFPEAPSPDGEFGNAIHETLEWLQHRITEQGTAPVMPETLSYFTDRMQRKRLAPGRLSLEIERGQTALAAYLTARLHQYKPSDRAEFNFRNEGVHLGDIRLSGKVDRLEIDPASRTITVVDYKTGKSYGRWESIPKLHRYRRQLYCYKLLVEQAPIFSGYTVVGGRLEFIEPDTSGNINTLSLAFTDEETERTKQLIAALWQHVQDLRFPDVHSYDASLSGIRRFEQDLIDGNI
jgi:DNA helicase-2/ATP-dependent DNA helicase PcrA